MRMLKYEQKMAEFVQCTLMHVAETILDHVF